MGGDAAPRPDILPGLDAYSSDAMALQHEVCRWLEPLQHDAGERMRLLDRIAYALHGLDELPGLRRRVRTGGDDVQVVGYRVTYEYAGQTFETITDAHPGDTIPVRVSVTPEG